MLILAIESSCDDLSIAITRHKTVLACVTYHSVSLHRQFGGIIPEAASRDHLHKLHDVLNKTLLKANISINELDYVAYTSQPGLIGSLLIGKVMAQAIASLINKPLIACNHLEGHVYSAMLHHQSFTFPMIALIVSGGHTQLYYLKAHGDFQVIGESVDDAVGECYDKVGRALNLPYPAGKEIDRLAAHYQWPAKYLFKHPHFKNVAQTDHHFNFSFSGFKTQSYQIMQQQIADLDVNNFAYSFQTSMINYIMHIVTKAINKYQPTMLVIGGGVALNSLLRNKIKNLPIKTLIPYKKYCADNAAMIGLLAYIKITHGQI